MKNVKYNEIVMACSGASNTGAYSDKVSRKIMNDGKAKILCLARFAVDKKFVEQTKKEIMNYDEVIVIDGCPINCAEKILGKLNVKDYRHINVTDFEIIKGKTPLTEEKVNEISEVIMNN